MSLLLTILFVLCVGGYAIAAAAVDLRSHRIPNYLTVPAALLGLAFHTLTPAGWGPLTALAGLAVGFGVLFVPWLLGGGGMGDVKLLAALGAWLGPTLVLTAFAASVLAAAVIAMIALSVASAAHGVSHAKRKYLAVGNRIAGQRRGRSRILPFAVPVAASTWLVLLYLVVQGGV